MYWHWNRPRAYISRSINSKEHQTITDTDYPVKYSRGRYAPFHISLFLKFTERIGELSLNLRIKMKIEMSKHMTGTRGVACSPVRAAQGGGDNAAQRRAGAAPSGAALGPGRQGVPIQTDEGSASLADLFRGRSQILVYHFMFGPDYTAGCPSCSAIADGFEGFVVHMANHDVTLSAVSRAPLTKLQEYKRRMGWTFPWASSLGSDFNFNFNFNVSFTEEQQREGVVEYNYRHSGHAMDATPVPEPIARFVATCGTDAPTYSRDRPGMKVS